MVFKLLCFLAIPFLITYHVFADCPNKIASLTLASDEILIEILEDKSRIAALTYLSSDSTVSNIADNVDGINKIHANIEQVIALEPDLVIIASYTNPDFLKQLKNSGIENVFLQDFSSFNSIKKNINIIGRAVCEEKRAGMLAERMDKKLEKLLARIPSNKAPPEVLYYSHTGNTAGKGSLVDDIIKKSGGLNLASKAGLDAYRKISPEYIIKADPDIIILSSFTPSDPDFTKNFMSRTVLQDISAVKNERVVIIPAKHLISASQHTVKSVEYLIEYFNDSYWKDDTEK